MLCTRLGQACSLNALCTRLGPACSLHAICTRLDPAPHLWCEGLVLPAVRRLSRTTCALSRHYIIHVRCAHLPPKVSGRCRGSQNTDGLGVWGRQDIVKDAGSHWPLECGSGLLERSGPGRGCRAADPGPWVEASHWALDPRQREQRHLQVRACPPRRTSHR